MSPLYDPYFVTQKYRTEGPEYPFRYDDLGRWVSRPTGQAGHFHGLELGVAYGTPVHAIANGMIIGASWENPNDHGAGMGLRIKHLISAYGMDSWMATYGFLSEVLVKPGQTVICGERIAYTGDSGASGGSKLRLTVADLAGQYRDIKFRDIAG